MRAVDALIGRSLRGEDAALAAALAANATAGLPAIDVSATQGRFLHLLARLIGRGAFLEVGTLGDKGWDGFVLAIVNPG